MRIADRHRTELDRFSADLQRVHGAASAAASIGRERGSKSGVPMSTDTSPSSRMRALTGPALLSMSISRPSCGALAYNSAATQRAPLPHCSTSLPSELKTAVEHAPAGIARRFEHQRLVESDTGVPIGESTYRIRR